MPVHSAYRPSGMGLSQLNHTKRALSKWKDMAHPSPRSIANRKLCSPQLYLKSCWQPTGFVPVYSNCNMLAISAVICCMSQPQDQQTGEHRAVPCTILGSLLPYLHSWQSCWAPAAVRQSLTRLPGSQGTLSEMGGEAQFWHTAPRHGPVFCITKRLWSSRRLPGPAQSTGWSFHFLTAYTPNATLLSLHWEGSQTLP